MDILKRLKEFITGIEAETQRDMGLQQMQEQIVGQLMAMAEAAGTYPQINDLYRAADGSWSLIFSMGGRVYQAPVSIEGTTVLLGNLTEIELMPTPVRMRTSIERQADGRVRFFITAAAATLNRVGEIDSRALFDSFVAHAEETGRYPQYRFHHDARMVLGQCDWLAREGNLYAASGLLDGGPLALAFIAAHEAGRGVWGNSIGFLPTEPPVMTEIARDVTIPMYTKGVNTEISALPEDSAASWFTSVDLEVTRSMDAKKREALIKLFGDEAKADAYIAGIDATNRAIAEKGLITREQPAGDAQPQPQPEERHATTEAEKADKLSKEEKAAAEAELTDRILAKAGLDKLEARLKAIEDKLSGAETKEQARAMSSDDMAAMLTAMDKRMQALEDKIAAMSKKTEERMAVLEAAEQERQRITREDMPGRALTATYRPRVEQAAPVEPVRAQDVAEATLAKIGKK